LRATLMYNHYPTINGNRSINRKSRPFGVEDRAPCPSCGAEMNLYGRSPEPVHHGYEVQMFSCMECDAEFIRSADHSRTRCPSSSNWRRCLQALRARWGKWNPTHRLDRPRRSGRCAGSTRSRSWLPVKCARMRPFSTSTRYQTLCHCLGSRHASCASAVTRSAHIFRLAGQRNQTGLIWPIKCRDERR